MSEVKQLPKPVFRVKWAGRHYAGYLYYQAWGSREQLISNGLCLSEWFPEGRKRVAYGDKLGPRDSFILRKLPQGQWRLMTWFPEGQGFERPFEAIRAGALDSARRDLTLQAFLSKLIQELQ